jgi:CelD/BcsL family acetyltransferase involved in cellulose biosynthesis
MQFLETIGQLVRAGFTGRGQRARTVPHPTIAGYTVSLYTTPDAIAEKWRAFEATSIGTLFQSFAWVSAWCRNVSTALGEEPLILVGLDPAEDIAFILPLAIVYRFGTKILTWLGQTHSGYGFGLYRRDAMERLQCAAIREILTYITARCPGLTVAHLNKQPLEWCGMRNPLAALPIEPCPIRVSAFDLQPDFSALYRTKISSKRRSDQRRLLNQLCRDSKVIIGVAAASEKRLEVFDVFRAQKATQLAALHRNNSFASPPINAFYRDLLTQQDDHVSTEVGFMRVDDEVVAVDISMRFQSRVYGLSRSITRGPLRRYAPGRHLNCYLVGRACEQGATIFDLGPGEASYKDEWKGCTVPLFATITPLRRKGWPAAVLLAAAARANAFLKRCPRTWRVVRSIVHRVRAIAKGG